VYGKFTDIATREENGINHKGIGGKCQLLAAGLQYRTVLHGQESGAVKDGNKHIFNQLVARPATTAMRQCNSFFHNCSGSFCLPSCRFPYPVGEYPQQSLNTLIIYPA
jgi:hypothetical protein